MSAGPASYFDYQGLHEAALEIILRNVPAGIVAVEYSAGVLFANAEAERILGPEIHSASAPGWTSACGLYLPDRVTPFPTERLPLARALAGEPVTNELAFLRNVQHPDGLWLRISSRAFGGTPDLLRGAICVYHDITGPRLAQDRIRLLSRAVEQTADSVVITNKAGIIEYVNPAFEATTGFTREEAIGATPRILKSGKHDITFYRELWKQLLGGEPFRGTIVNRKKSGELYWAEQTITPIRDEHGAITQFVSVLKDITELRKRQEQQLELKLAHDLQQRFYGRAQTLPGFDIGISAHPAKETGGDYADFVAAPDGSVFIAVGDAVGHGVSAAILIALTRAYVRAFVLAGMDAGQVLSRVNQMLVADLDQVFHIEKSWFVTLLLVHLKPRHQALSYASAGHVSGYLLDCRGHVENVLASTGMPLGLFRDQEFTSHDLPFGTERLLLLLTDGATEATNAMGADCGPERLLAGVAPHCGRRAQCIADSVYEAVHEFAGAEPLQDDVTAVVVKVE